MAESTYKSKLRKKIEKMFPGCVVLTNDANYKQGIPDLTIIYGPHWAMLEVKMSANAPERPNQRYYVEKMAKMYFASFIYPENEEEVLRALQAALGNRRKTRLS